jgi:hypothetical protein
VNFLMTGDVDAIVPMLREAVRKETAAALEGMVEDQF